MATVVDNVLQGIINSLRLDRAVCLCYSSQKTLSKLWNIIFWNYFMILFPGLLVSWFEQRTGIQPKGLFLMSLDFILIIIFGVATITNLVLCIDLTHHLSQVIPIKRRKSTPNPSDLIFNDPISLSIMMSIFQCIILFSTHILNILPLPYVECLSFLVLTIYHSFIYFHIFSNQKGYTITEQFNLYETNWIYYVGYGIPISILSIFSGVGYHANYIIGFIYNIYYALLIIITFLVIPPPALTNNNQFIRVSLRPYRFFTKHVAGFIRRSIISHS
jgi:hypothetical protein